MSNLIEKVRVDERDFANAERTKVLNFYIDEQVYGIEIPYVIEIITIQAITVVPGIPHYIKGIINVRGKIVPVMNVRHRFGKPEIDYDERTCIIIVAIGDLTVGLIVDMVSEVMPVANKHVSLTPDNRNVNASKYINYIVKIGDDVKLILDVRKLINDGDEDLSAFGDIGVSDIVL